MKRMNAIGLMVAILGVVLPATGAAAKTVHYRASLTTAQLSTANGYPGKGSTALLAGSLTTSAFGPGALVDRVRITGSPQPNVFTFTGTEVDYYAAGSLRSRFEAMDVVGDDGTQHVQVTGRFTGGTGPYHGATGHYRFTGTSAPGSTILKGTSSGDVST
jgi:hypothetical protein